MDIGDGLEGFPDLDISEETEAAIVEGEWLAKKHRKLARDVIELANRLEDYPTMLRRVAVAHAQVAREALDAASFALSAEWKTLEDVMEFIDADEESSDSENGEDK